MFAVKLNKLEKKELPEVNDEFIKDAAGVETVEEYKKQTRERLEKQAKEKGDAETENNIVKAITETAEVEIPDAMIENQIDVMVRNAEYRLGMQYGGIKLEDYLKYIGGDEAKFREGFKEQAEKQVKIRLALEAVAAAEGIAASEEDFENEVKRIADAYKMEVEKVRGIVPEAEVKKDLAVNKAIDFIKQHGGKHIKFMCVIAAPEGLERLRKAHPDVQIYVGHLDRQLNEKAYICPGLGDAGDRIFGTK